MDSCENIFNAGCLHTFVSQVENFLEKKLDALSETKSEALRSLFDEAYKASLLEEEGRRVRFRLLVDILHTPESELFMHMQVCFDNWKDFKIEAGTLRRTSPIAPPEKYGFVVFMGEKDLFVCGISDTSSFEYQPPSIFQLLVTAPACMDVIYGKETIYSYHRGAILEYTSEFNPNTKNKPRNFTQVVNNEYFKHALSDTVKEYLTFLRHRLPSIVITVGCVRRCYAHLCKQLAYGIDSLRKVGSGGAVVFIPGFKKMHEYLEGVDAESGDASDKWQKAHICCGKINARAPFNWPGWDLLETACFSAHKSENDPYDESHPVAFENDPYDESHPISFENALYDESHPIFFENDPYDESNLISFDLKAGAQLTAMDGSVFVGPNFQPLLFGVHLHIPKNMVIQEYWDGFEDREVSVSDNPLGGLRHRSAFVHCKQHGHISFVMSQDGYLTIVCPSAKTNKRGEEMLVAWRQIE